MSVSLYDRALATKIEKWLNNEKSARVRVLKPGDAELTRLFKIKADETNDAPISLPIIALSRASTINILNTNKRPLSYEGMKIKCYDKDGNFVPTDSVLKLTAIPMELEYQLDIITSEVAEADEYLRNFTFNFVNLNKVNIQLPYKDCKLIHESTVYMHNEVEDNSDIPLRLVPGQFTRYTITLSIDNAYMFSASPKQNILISDLQLDVAEPTGEVTETNEIEVD